MRRWRSGDPATDAEIKSAFEQADRLRGQLADARAVDDAETILSDARELALQVLMAAASQERQDAQAGLGPALEQEDEDTLRRARDRLTSALETEIMAADDLADHLEAVRVVARERVDAAVELLARLHRADRRAIGLVHAAQEARPIGSDDDEGRSR
ncbi:hypothetical protein [Actinomadura hibisca]|uniref:hypothetical protein n=1 Tax=Actinomadura hibisca TaxID=68565 RepID=UPI00082B9ACE|nr:hypothetical protein [Actinomadura hibisca]